MGDRSSRGWGDIRNLDFENNHPSIAAPFRSFHHLLTVEDQLASLRFAYRHLDRDGRLVFDVFNPSLEARTEDNLGQESGEEPEFTVPDGRRAVRWHKIVGRDLFHQAVGIRLIYYGTHRDGRKERLVHAIRIRYFFRYELERLVVRCGFTLENVFSDFEGRP